MTHVYEIEIKSLLGEKDKADELKDMLSARGGLEELGRHSQLNHYFETSGDLSILKDELLPVIPTDKKDAFARIVKEGSDHSVRTREADGKVLFVVKASVGDDSSANGVSRMEFEVEVDMTLDELDRILLDSGLSYQAKWSRDREEFRLGDMNITIDKNAGYGYLAEFEKVVKDGAATEEVEKEIRDFMQSCGVEELPQDRLERMFAYYNENWEDYYGTDKIFNIE